MEPRGTRGGVLRRRLRSLAGCFLLFFVSQNLNFDAVHAFFPIVRIREKKNRSERKISVRPQTDRHTAQGRRNGVRREKNDEKYGRPA